MQLTRYYTYLSFSRSPDCTHVWFDINHEELKNELTRIQQAFYKAITKKTGKNFYAKFGYLTSKHIANIKLAPICGMSTKPLVNGFVPVIVTEEDKSNFHDEDLPIGINPNDWEIDNEDYYSFCVTEKGIQFVLNDDSSFDRKKHRIITPIIPFNYLEDK